MSRSGSPTSARARREEESGSGPGRITSLLSEVVTAVEQRVVGRRRAVERLVTALITGGHVLLEGPPGLGKTLLVRTLAESFDASFGRIQFTPDLLPADLIGTLVWREQAGEFRPRKGPVFANLVLADEVNRAPAKVQSALLEAMQEGQVTLGETSHPLPDPFLVMATQNPIEQEGTYPLPAAQTDRFAFKLLLEPPDRDEEREILRRETSVGGREPVPAVATPRQMLRARRSLDEVDLADEVAGYILDLVRATRDPGAAGLEELEPWLQHGASPRATLHLARAARATALLQGRTFVVPRDVRGAVGDTLRHRLVLTPRARVEDVTADGLLDRVVERTPLP